jgi:hypothetical protein
MENAQREAGEGLGEEAELISVELYGRKISFPNYAGEAVRFAQKQPTVDREEMKAILRESQEPYLTLYPLLAHPALVEQLQCWTGP